MDLANYYLTPPANENPRGVPFPLHIGERAPYPLQVLSHVIFPARRLHFSRKLQSLLTQRIGVSPEHRIDVLRVLGGLR